MQFLSQIDLPSGLPITEGGTGATTVVGARSNLGLGGASLAGASGLHNGRLTLQSGTPVTSTDQVGISSLYFTSWDGNVFSVYDGSDWIPYTFSEQSRTLTGLTSGKNYDVFGYATGGAFAFDLGPAWTSDIARSSGVSLLNGVYVNTSSITGVLGGAAIGASQGVLIGTIRATGASTTEDSYAKRLVANYLNSVQKLLYRVDGTAHTYSGTAIRGWNGQNTHTVEWVSPITRDALLLTTTGGFFAPGTGTQNSSVGLGLVTTEQYIGMQWYAGLMSNTSILGIDPGIGWRRYYVTEAAGGSTNTQFYYYYVQGLVLV